MPAAERHCSWAARYGVYYNSAVHCPIVLKFARLVHYGHRDVAIKTEYERWDDQPQVAMQLSLPFFLVSYLLLFSVYISD